jgi:two-component SAPR family response regulator
MPDQDSEWDAIRRQQRAIRVIELLESINQRLDDIYQEMCDQETRHEGRINALERRK